MGIYFAVKLDGDDLDFYRNPWENFLSVTLSKSPGENLWNPLEIHRNPTGCIINIYGNLWELIEILWNFSDMTEIIRKFHRLSSEYFGKIQCYFR